MASTESFGIAAESFIELVERIRPEQWDDPGLGSWTVRELVGHTSRAILTVELYLAEPEPDHVNVPDAETYYAEVMTRYTDDEAIAARGVEAAEKLGADPVSTLTAYVVRASAAAAAASDDRVIGVGPLGIPLSEYLRTRVLELVVHGIDISRATGLEHQYPDSIVAETATLAASVAVRKGLGDDLLQAMTGRGPLPKGFTVLR